MDGATKMVGRSEENWCARVRLFNTVCLSVWQRESDRWGVVLWPDGKGRKRNISFAEGNDQNHANERVSYLSRGLEGERQRREREKGKVG